MGDHSGGCGGSAGSNPRIEVCPIGASDIASLHRPTLLTASPTWATCSVCECIDADSPCSALISVIDMR